MNELFEFINSKIIEEDGEEYIHFDTCVKDIDKFKQILLERDELTLSIQKWSDIETFLKRYSNVIVCNYASTCSLCRNRRYGIFGSKIACEGLPKKNITPCPVFINTKQDGCEGTPWKKEIKLEDATAMHKFLESLKEK